MTLRPARAGWEPAEQLSAAVVEAVRLRCPALTSLTLHSCAIDVTRVRLSLFPRSLHHLHLHSCALVNQGDPTSQAATSSPFHSIKRHLPLLLPAARRQHGGAGRVQGAGGAGGGGGGA